MTLKPIPFLMCKDHTVSRETFGLYLDKEKELLITKPQPKKEDLGKYYESDAYISHTDSSKNVLEKTYQLAKNYAIKKKVRLIEKESFVKTNLQILDIGCGTGDFLKACKNKNWHVIGVEPNKNARVLAKNKLGILETTNLTYTDFKPKIFDSIKSIEKNKQFDIISMWHVLEHIPDLENYITQLKKLLKPNGTLLIAVPNYKSFDAKHYKEFWAAYDVPRHLWHFSQKAISILFKKENLCVVKTIPMKLDSFYVSLLSEKIKNGKTKPVKAFLIGLLSNIKAMRSSEYSSLIYLIKNS